ncbi:oligosaccharide flippase family protein [Stutzerimonas kunmingensis]|uniref:oligosaccharide flippase family protein n=1 Tax=Stutzerimonas kunmingensis TaxID=1211807 RepID=UPI0028AFF64D|nr:oligosaccharide flippase family protein [Stutzerimonas kunmingensis]
MNSKHKKVAKNTLILYFRMLFIALISFYIVRVVLDALGVEDYGIYNVVAGIVALSSFIPTALSSATQRYFSFALGENDLAKLEQVFSTNLIIYIGVAVVATLLLETIGFYIVSQHLKLPEDKAGSAMLLYHLAVFAFAFSIFSAPFMAIIISHEDMNIYAVITVTESIAKLMAVLFLAQLPFDRLVAYGWLMMLVALAVMLIYIVTSFRKYPECHLRKVTVDKALAKEILGFTGWTIFGSFTTIIRTHGVTVLLNQMFNPTIVAARAIAIQVVSFTNIFAQSFNTALYPPIIKSYAENKKIEMHQLVFDGSKLTFFLMWILLLPIILKIEFLIDIWLKNAPAETYLFAQLALLESLIFAISMPLTTAARAPGNMRLYELTLGTIQLLILPMSWLVLYFDYPAYSVFVVAISVNLVMFFVRLLLVEYLTGLSSVHFIKQVLSRVMLVVLVSGFVMYNLEDFFQNTFGSVVLYGAISVVLTSVVIFLIGVDQKTREKLKSFGLKFIKARV